ncbi:MAG: hypothetical protein WD960_07065 [Gemmatimonadota bacterium]
MINLPPMRTSGPIRTTGPGAEPERKKGSHDDPGIARPHRTVVGCHGSLHPHACRYLDRVVPSVDALAADHSAAMLGRSGHREECGEGEDGH